jgi:hypothetical protein
MTDNKLNDNELDVLVIRLQHMNAKEIQYCLDRNMFSAKERPYIEGYLPRKIEEERNTPVILYHRRKAPEGKIFKTYEVRALEMKGWVDSPSKIKKDARDKIIDIMKWIYAFWCKEYKWILGFIVIIISLYLTYLKLTINK